MIENLTHWEIQDIEAVLDKARALLYKDECVPEDLPHLISRLIELGGVAVKWPDIRSEWHPVECPSIFKHLLENYHIIPKADKKEAE